jgi:hypothetical protein
MKDISGALIFLFEGIELVFLVSALLAGYYFEFPFIILVIANRYIVERQYVERVGIQHSAFKIQYIRQPNLG